MARKQEAANGSGSLRMRTPIWKRTCSSNTGTALSWSKDVLLRRVLHIIKSSVLMLFLWIIAYSGRNIALRAEIYSAQRTVACIGGHTSKLMSLELAASTALFRIIACSGCNIALISTDAFFRHTCNWKMGLGIYTLKIIKSNFRIVQ